MKLPTSMHSIRSWLEIASFGILVVAVAWWGIVFGQAMANTGLPLDRTLPCLLHTSDRCSLAMSLCKSWHFLGIRRYSPELLWFGAAATLLTLLLGVRRGDAPQSAGEDKS